ncbi:AAA family ATPase [Rugamonas sp. CCM 8940]|uniref:LuxR family transcriptional regulator n=1 Tax=Rugamonas sp. CCM 8940 TaxID=2765359 RepID=UPI0018F4EA1C|nr:AAA family ATPase [Rugamonas sp. CCM 8940]MBJ7313933.1 AAA family ATPase [Rugamonas sp. CCM 8940]
MDTVRDLPSAYPPAQAPPRRAGAVLHGRDGERAALREAYARVAAGGGVELLMLSGGAGSGKSALAHSLRQPVLLARGWFGAGRGEPGGYPYACLGQACGELVRQVLTDSKPGVAAWKVRLQAALGGNAQLMVALVPALERLLGRPAAPPVLPPLAAQQRLRAAFRDLLGAFARPGQPLVLFLDDLQWADPASLALLRDLLGTPGPAALLLLGAYRQPPAPAGAPLARLMAAAVRAGVPLTRIDLAALPPEALGRLVGERLSCRQEDGAALADLLWRRAAGLPGMALRLLDLLDQQGLLRLEADSGRCHWDAGAVAAAAWPAGLDALARARLARLTPASRWMLGQLAGLGGSAGGASLAVVCQRTAAALAPALDEAERAGLLWRDGARYCLQRELLDEAAEHLLASATSGEAEALRKGWLLLAAAGPAARGEALFELLAQLNRGAGLIADGAARRTLYRLNCAAAQQAKAMSAHAAAADYLRQAGRLRSAAAASAAASTIGFGLGVAAIDIDIAAASGIDIAATAQPPAAHCAEAGAAYVSAAAASDADDANDTDDADDSNGAGQLAWRLDLAESASLAGQHQPLERLAAELYQTMADARGGGGAACARRALARLALLRAGLHRSAGRFGEALALLLDAARHFQPALPRQAAAIDAAIAAQRVVLAWRPGRSDMAGLALATAPVDADAAALIDLLAAAQDCAYLACEQLFPLIVLSALNLCLRHGHPASAALIYGGYAMLLAADGEIAAAHDYAELALRLNASHGDAPGRAALLAIQAKFVHCWRQRHAACAALARQAFDACVAAGEQLYASCAAYSVVQIGLERGDAIELCLHQSRDYSDWAGRYGNPPIHQMLRLQQQAMLDLQGATPRCGSFDDAGFSEAQCLALLAAAGFAAGLAEYQLMKLRAAYLHGRYDEALGHGQQSSRALRSGPAGISEATHCYYYGLTLAALHAAAGAARQPAMLAELAEQLARLARWARHNPADFEHRHALLAAEIARIELRELDAMRLYERAIEQAGAHGFIQHAALAKELAAQFYRAGGFARSADAYLREARDGYQRWGAARKVAQLELRHPQLRGGAAAAQLAGAEDLLLQTKLAPPPMPERLLALPRLERQLDRAGARRLVCLVAPAGYGKTTTLARLRAGAQARGVRAGWLNLDRGDNDPLRFLHGLAAALQCAAPELGGAALALARAGRGAAPAQEPVLRALYRELAGLDAPLALFLDDYHAIDNPVVHEAMNWLLAQHLPQLTLLLASRADLPLALSKLRLADQVHELRADELGLDVEEAGRLVSTVSGRPLAAAQLHALHQRTEGWPAALQLAALALRRVDDAAGFVAAFSGSDRDITAYLGEIVLAQLPAETVEFLLSSALFERFSADFCATALGLADAARLLDGVKAQQLFLVALAPERRWYRYHHLFGDYLRARCLRARPESARALYRRGAAWFERQGRVAEAIPCALAGQDYARAADLIVAHAYQLVHLRDQDATLLSWIAALPPQYVERRPEIKLPGIYAYLISYRYAEAEAEIAKLQRLLASAAPTATAAMTTTAPAATTAATAPQPDDVARKTLMMQAIFHALSGRVAPAAQICREWLARWGESDPNDVGNMLVVQGYSALVGRDYAGAVAHFLAAKRSYRHCPRPPNGLAWAETLHALALWERGDVLGAEALLGAVMGANPQRFDPYPACYGSCLIALVQAQSCYELNRMARAEALLDQVFAFTKANGCIETTMAAYLTRARILFWRGAADAADVCLAEGMALAERNGLARLRRTLAAERVDLQLKAGRPQAARRIGQELESEPAGAAPAADDIGVRIAVLRLRLAQVGGGEDSAAALLLAQLLAQARGEGRHGWTVRLLCLQAGWQLRGGRDEAARDSLRRALALGAVHGQCRSLADECGELFGLIEQIRLGAVRGTEPDQQPPDYLERLLQACERRPAAGGEAGAGHDGHDGHAGQDGHAGHDGQDGRDGRDGRDCAGTAPAPSAPSTAAAAAPPAGAAEQLSEREVQILKLVNQGLSNRKLAALLFLSEATVKWHLHNIYTKLHVNNRTSALARARELLQL